MKRITTPFKISAISSALLFSMVWSITSYSTTDSGTDNLSYKEKIQLDVKDNVSTNVSTAIKDAVASCKSNQGTSTCKDKYPFHLYDKQTSIDNLSACLTKETLSCVSEKLSSNEDIPPPTNPASSDS